MTKKVELPKLYPMSDYLLVKPEPPEAMSKGGIVIPDTAKKKKTLRGEIVAVGPGFTSPEGTYFPMERKPGESVIFDEYTGLEFRHNDGEEYILVRQQDCKASY